MNRQVKFAQNMLGWGALALAIVGVIVGTSSRTARLGGGTLTCGSPWAPVDQTGMSYIYPAVARACENALGNGGAIAVVLVLLGVVMAVGLLVSLSARPTVGTQDHP